MTDWTAPGRFEVAPGVHRIPLPLPNDALRAVNVYAISGAGGLTVTDSGWVLDLARERLKQALAGLGHTLGDLNRLLMTYVHRLLAHRATRLEECERATTSGAATALDVAARLLWTRRGRTLGELDVFNQMMAVLETAAHLDVLVMQGRLRAEVRDSVTGYGPR